MNASDGRRARPLPGWWIALASVAAAATVFAVVFTVGIALSHDEQAGWGTLLTVPMFSVSFPVVVAFLVHAFRRHDRHVRRQPLRVVAVVAGITVAATGAMVGWGHLQEHRDLERERAVAPGRAYSDEVSNAYRDAAAAHGLSGWDHVPAKEMWLLDLDRDGRIDRDAAPMVALPTDGTVRAYDADDDLVVDAIEVTTEEYGVWCVDVRWIERIDGFAEMFHEAREGPCPMPDSALVRQ